jgi:hypothetical protein
VRAALIAKSRPVLSTNAARSTVWQMNPLRIFVRTLAIIGAAALFATAVSAAETKQSSAASEDDFVRLRERAAILSVTKDAVGWRVNNRTHSLDIKIGNLSSQRAEAAAHFACEQPFGHSLSRFWSVRVYLVDGHLAAECPIWQHK